MHFSNDNGDRSAAIFTVADKQLETFAGNDIQFAEGFQFIEGARKTESVAVDETPKDEPPAREEVSVKVDSPDAKVANKPEAEAESGGLQLNSAVK